MLTRSNYVQTTMFSSDENDPCMLSCNTIPQRQRVPRLSVMCLAIAAGEWILMAVLLIARTGG